MADSVLGVDLGDTPDKLRQLVEDLAAAERALGQFSKTTETFDDNGNVISRVAKVATETGKTISVSFKDSDGVLKGVSASITNTTNKLLESQKIIKNIANALNSIDIKGTLGNLTDREIKTAQNNLAKIGQGVNFSTVGSSADSQKIAQFERDRLASLNSIRQLAVDSEATLKGLFPAPTETTIAGLRAYDNAIKLIIKDIKDGKISADQFNQAITGNATGRLGVQLDALKKASTGGRTDVASLRQTVEATFPAPSTATSNQLIAYNNGLIRIERTLQSSAVTAERFREILGSVTSGKQLPNLTIDERQIVAGLNRVKNSFSDIKNASDSATLTLNNFARIGAALAFKRTFSELVQEVHAAVGEVLKLQIAIAEIRTISQSANASSLEWSQTITRLSNQFGISQADVAEAAYQGLSSQLVQGTKDTEAYLAQIAEFARVTKSTLPEALNLTSAVLNSYGETTAATARYTAQLFKIIEQGKTRVEDISKSFGRLTPIAAELGIKLGDIGAIFVKLTQKGVSPDTAVTQTLNLINQLQNPSKELQDLIRSLGYESIQSAIAGDRFLQFLDEVGKKADGSSAELAKLLKNIRGRAGFVGSFSDELKPLSNSISNAGPEFDIAKQIRAEPAADTLIKEFTKVKNFIINDVGTNIVNTFAKISEAVGGISGPIISVLGGIEVALKGLIIGGTAYAAVTLVNSANNLRLALTTSELTVAEVTQAQVTELAARAAITEAEALAALTLAKKEAAVASIRLGETEKTAAGFSALRFGALAAIGYSLGEIFLAVNNNITKVNTNLQNTKNSVTQVVSDLETAQKKILDQNNVNFEGKVNAATGPIIANLAGGLKEVNAALDAIRDNAKSSAEEMNAALADFGKQFNDSLQDAKKAIQESRTQIRGFATDVNGFNAKIRNALFAVSEKYANPQQQIDLLTGQINRLNEENLDLQKKGDLASLEQFKKNSEELIGLYQKRFEKITELQKQNVKNAPPSLTELYGAERNGKKLTIDREFLVDPSNLQGQLKQLQDAYAQGLKSFTKSLTESGNTLKAEVFRQEDLLKRLQQKVSDLNKFNPFTQNNQLKNEFVNPATGGLDAKKLQDQINKLTDTSQFNELKKTPPAGATDAQKAAFDASQKLFKDIEDRKTQIFKEAELERQQFKLQQDQIFYDKLNQQLKDTQKKNSGEQAKLNDSFSNDVKQAIKDLNDLKALIPDIVSKQKGTIANLIASPKELFEDKQAIVNLQSKLQSLQQLGAKIALSGLDTDPKQIELFQQKYKALLDELSKGDVSGGVQGPNGVRGTVGDLIRQLQNSDFTKPIGEFKRLQEEIDKAQANVDKLAKIADPLKANITDPATKAIDPLEKVRKGLQGVYDQMEKIRNLGPINPIGGNGPLSSNTGSTGFSPSLTDNSPPVSFANEGGLVGGLPGRDANLIMANKDEYIVNSEATRQFRPILDMMNASKIYNNSLQIGDVHVSSGGENGSQIGQDIISQLRRAVRQGQFRIGN